MRLLFIVLIIVLVKGGPCEKDCQGSSSISSPNMTPDSPHGKSRCHSSQPPCPESDCDSQPHLDTHSDITPHSDIEQTPSPESESKPHLDSDTSPHPTSKSDSLPDMIPESSKTSNSSSSSSPSKTSKPKHDSCNADDEPCVEAIVNQFAAPVLKKIIREVVESSQSLLVELIPGNFSILKYHGTQNNVTGLKACSVKKMNVAPDLAAAQFALECPSIKLKGHYNLCGYFLYIPVMGNGTYEIEYGKRSISVYSKIKQVKGCNDQTYLQLGDFTIFVRALSPTKYNFHNLYNGNKYLTKIVNNFASCHWYELSFFDNEPIWNNILLKVFSECNKRLLKAPAENLFMSCNT